MNDGGKNLVDYDANSDRENNNAREEEEITPNALSGEQEPAEKDQMDPADVIPEWYRKILGNPESWNDDKWQKYLESLTSTGGEDASSGDTETAGTIEILFSQYV